MLFVVFEEWSYASPTTPNVLQAKDNWDLCLMNTSKLQRKLIIKLTKLLLRFQLTQLLNLFTLIYCHVIKMHHREVCLRLLMKPNLQLFLKVLMMTIMILKLYS